MSVQNSDWSLQQDNPIFREPDPPVYTDSDSGRRPVEDYEDTSAQVVGVPLFLRLPWSHPLAPISLLPTS
jgi:hypothetical protein